MTDPLPLVHPLPRIDDGHLPLSWVAGYAEGSLSSDLITHTEAHLLACRHCSGAVNSSVQNGIHGMRLDAMRGALLSRLGGPPPPSDPPPPAGPDSGRPGRRPPWLAAVHGLRLPWLLAVLAVCTAGVGLAHLHDNRAVLPSLLLLAPVLPLLCVAASYGGKADPFAEVTRTAPSGGLRLLLIRTGQVLALCVPLLSMAALALPRTETLEASPAGWLLPCLVLTLATLVLSSYVDSRVAALLTSGGWLLVVGAVAHLCRQKSNPRATDMDRLADALSMLLVGTVQMVYAIGAAVLVELLFLRRHAYNTPAPGDRRPSRGRRDQRAPR